MAIVSKSSAATVLVMLLVVCGGYSSTSRPGTTRRRRPPPAASPAVPVAVAISEAKDVPIFVRGLGNVQAYNMVAVKSRVDGQIVKIDFKEGQDVKAGDPLIQIDPRPYQAALEQAQATKQKDEAQLAGAQLDLARYEQLVGTGLPDPAELRQPKARSRSCRPRSRATRRRSRPPSSISSYHRYPRRRSTGGSAHASSTRAIWCAPATTRRSSRSPR